MKKKIIAIAAIIAVFSGTLGVTSFAFGTQKSITVNDGVSVYMNGEELNMTDVNGNPVSGFVYDGTTYVPARAISEANGKDVAWDQQTGTVYITDPETADETTQQDTQESSNVLTTNSGDQVNLSSLEHRTDSTDAPVVYYTSDISSESLVKMYDALGVDLPGNVGVKMSTGEAGNENYLHPEFIKSLVDKVNGTVIECNTAYGGSRATTAVHEQTIKDHGFDLVGGVDIMDRDGEMELPVVGGEHLSVDYVGKNLANYDSVLVLSHFKGHAMGGFGGALKNISIGMGSAAGKVWIHTAGTSKTGSIMHDDQEAFIESMAEAAKAVDDHFGDNIVYINVMNNLSVDCDCNGSPADPTMGDIGILASTDPVALDQACVDLVYAVPDGSDLIERMESRMGPHILEHAEDIGFGTTNYSLVNLDD